MKIVKRIFVFLFVFFILYIFISYIEYNRVVKDNENLLFKINTQEIKKDKSKIYNGIFYKLIIYNETNSEIKDGKALKKEYKSLFFNKKIYAYLDYYENPIDKDSYNLNNVEPDDNFEKIYSDDNYNYYTNNLNKKYIVFSNNEKIELKKAIDINMVNFNDLVDKGISVINILKNTKENNLINISVDSLNKKINNKESFILLIMQKGCSHCESFDPKFNRVLVSYGINSYYVDLRSISDNEYESFKKIATIKGTPTVLFFDKGQESIVDRISGDMNETFIVNKLYKKGYLIK